MSIETYQFNLPITPGSIPPVLHLSQYDSGRTFTAILRDDQGVPFELDASSTAVIKGRNAAGIAWQQDCTVSGANVTFTPSGAATDQFGVMPVTIEITESDEIISPLCVVFHIQKAGYTNEEAVLSPDFETAIQAAVAQAISEGGLGFSDEFKEALLACFNGVAWATTGGQALVDDLEAALYPDVQLSSITAAYEQDRPIYDTDDLDAIKTGDDLTVTANYSDGSSVVLGDDDYTLSGTLTAGTSTITVTYLTKTTTISVFVTHQIAGWLYRFEQSLASDGTKDIGWTGSPTYSTGHDGTGYCYDSTDGCIETTSYTPPNLSGDFTISWWQKSLSQNLKGQGISPFTVGSSTAAASATGCGDPQNIKSGYTVEKDSAIGKATEGCRIFWSSGRFQIRCITPDLAYGANYNVTPPSGFSSLTWHHFAITRKNNILRFFIDGEMIFSAEVTIALFWSTQIAFGGYYNGAGSTTASASSYKSCYDDLFIAEYCKWDSDFDASAIEY